MSGPDSGTHGDAAVMLGALGAGAYLVADLVHEVVGHGGACLASGGTVERLSSAYFRCHPGGTAVDVAGPVPAIREAALETFGASIGLLLAAGPRGTGAVPPSSTRAPVARDPRWVAVVAVLYVLFIAVMGHGIITHS